MRMTAPETTYHEKLAPSSLPPCYHHRHSHRPRTFRLRAVRLLPIDYDEDDYLAAAQRYAQAIDAGDVRCHRGLRLHLRASAVEQAGLRPGHPAVAASARFCPKTSPSLPPASTLPQPHFRYARLTAAAFGTLEVLALAIFDPVAGLFLAISTWQIKYTSQIMLEPLPALMSVLAVLFYVRARQETRLLPGAKPGFCWLVLLSAVAFGLTEAAKYTYGVAGIAILVHWLWTTRPASPDCTLPTRKEAGEAVGSAGWGRLPCGA